MAYRRSPARWLAPLAILVALVTIFAIVNSTTGSDDTEESTPQAEQSENRKTSTGAKGKSDGGKATSGSKTGTSTTPAPERKTYKVRPGDTLAGIAESTGVSVEEIQELNPDVDSNSLSIGQEIRLAR